MQRHAAPLATKPGKALGRKTIFLADSAFRTAGKIAFSPVMSVVYLRQVLPGQIRGVLLAICHGKILALRVREVFAYFTMYG